MAATTPGTGDRRSSVTTPPTSCRSIATSGRWRSISRTLPIATWPSVSPAKPTCVIANFRPGVLERFGLGYDDLADPASSTARSPAFGPGVREDDPGYDIVMQALTGFMSMTGSAGGEPAKMGVALLDVITGLYAAIAVMGGLEARRRTGASQRVTIPLFDCRGLAALANQAANHLLGGDRAPCHGDRPSQHRPLSGVRRRRRVRGHRRRQRRPVPSLSAWAGTRCSRPRMSGSPPTRVGWPIGSRWSMPSPG